jgi:hypothetical protein
MQANQTRMPWYTNATFIDFTSYLFLPLGLYLIFKTNKMRLKA